MAYVVKGVFFGSHHWQQCGLRNHPPGTTDTSCLMTFTGIMADGEMNITILVCRSCTWAYIFNKILKSLLYRDLNFVLLQILIRALCKLEPRDRLGYQKGRFGDVRKQKWYQGFDWQGLRARRIASPFDIQVNSQTDTKYFENVVKEEPINKAEDLKIIQKAKDLEWDLSF